MTEDLQIQLTAVVAFVVFALLASGIIAGGLYAFGTEDEDLPRWAKRLWDARLFR